MHENKNSKLINAINLSMPVSKDCINFLAATLSISRRSAQRRMNNEVPFTYEEAASIAEALNLSLDNLSTSNNISVDLAFRGREIEPVELARLALESYFDLCENAQQEGRCSLNIACNSMPYSNLVKYDYLYKFFVYKKYFQKVTSMETMAFSDLEVPDNHRIIRKRVQTKFDSIESATIIFDKHIISEVVDDILYFKELTLLNQDDLSNLQADLIEFIKDLEFICSSAKNIQGNEVNIYISDISLDASYGYIETPQSMYAQVRLHSLNTAIITNQVFCEMQKRWINSVKKYSTLISRGGEVEKKMFIERQRSYCEQITS